MPPPPCGRGILFNDSIFNNIAYGELSTSDSDKVIEASSFANALDFINNFPEKFDTTISSPIPEKDSGIATFTREAIDSVNIKSSIDDSLQVINASSGIELYYVLAMTPVSESKDRYVFDGEAPFGIAVNQIPPIGNATHLQHGISADLSILQEGETYDLSLIHI